MVPRRSLRAGTLVLLLLHLGLSGAEASNPFGEFKSKQEAVAAFEEVERAQQAGNKSAGALRPLYEQWKRRFGQSFSPAEDARRYAVFTRTVQKIIACNRDASVHHWSGLNAFAATTWAEFRAARLSRNVANADAAKWRAEAKAHVKARAGAGGEGVQPKAGVPTVPEAVDWHAAGRTTRVKDQGKCNSCWAFAAAAVLESRVLIQRNVSAYQYPIDLSEQQLVDCVNKDFDSSYHSVGCDGGQTTEALQYAARYFVTTERRYSYASKDDGLTKTCNVTRLDGLPPADRLQSAWAGSGGGWEMVYPYTDRFLIEAVANQPVAIVFEAAPSFQTYTGGVYTPTDCGTRVNHAMVVVGYNLTIGDGGPYWIIRNSWGTRWGEQGYARVAMQRGLFADGTCLMYSYPIARPVSTASWPVLPRITGY